ncbi:unnamed protein product, partial [Hymenolepis diminuta]
MSVTSVIDGPNLTDGIAQTEQCLNSYLVAKLNKLFHAPLKVMLRSSLKSREDLRTFIESLRLR